MKTKEELLGAWPDSYDPRDAEEVVKALEKQKRITIEVAIDLRDALRDVARELPRLRVAMPRK